MSYKKAWRAVQQAGGQLGIRLRPRRTREADGSGSELTEGAALLMERFRAFPDEADADLDQLYEKYYG